MTVDRERQEMDRFESIRALFLQAVDVSADQQEEFLKRHCEDASLREEVWSLLQESTEVSPWLGDPSTKDRASPWPHPLNAGDRLGEYEIIKPLGRGGLGEVYLARQTSLDRQVALKVVDRRVMTDRERARFRREARVTAALSHPHLVPIYGYGEDAKRDRLYYSMRQIQGQTFGELLDDLQGQPLNRFLRNLVERCWEAASGVGALHRAGLIHRDVQPANVMVEGAGEQPWTGTAVVIDFGLVRPALSLARQRSTLWMTPHYAAPEVLRGDVALPQSDVFSLGLMLYDAVWIALGSPRTSSPAGALPRWPRLPELIDELCDVVAKATAPRAEWRYPDAGHLAADLRAVLDGRAPVATSPTMFQRARRWTALHPAEVLRGTGRALVVLLLFVAVTSCLLLVRDLWGRRQALAASWEQGDLAGLVEFSPGLEPAWWAPSAVRESMEESDSRDKLFQLEKSSRREPVVRSCLLAAKFLAQSNHRDGFLRRWLHGQWRDGDLSDREALLLATQRLFYESPVVDAAVAQAYEPFRRSILEELLQPERTPWKPSLLAVLSGLGDLRAFRQIATWFAASGSRPTEESKQVLEVLGAIVRHSHRRGASPDLEGIHGVLSEVATAHLANGAGLEELVTLQRDLDLFLRSRGRTLGPPMDPVVLTHDLVRSARQDPEIRETLLRGKSLNLGHLSPESYAQRLGWACGYYGEELAELGQQWVARLGDELEHRFSHGLQEADLHCQGILPDFAPDPDTTLIADSIQQGWIAPTWRIGDRVTGAWQRVDFRPSPPTVSSTDLGLRLRQCPLQSDEINPGTQYARLAPTSQSGIRLRAFVPPSFAGTVYLRVIGLKGNRRLLPKLGTAGLELLVDGEPHGTAVLTDREETAQYVLPCLPGRAFEAELLLHLDEASTTTARVLEISIGH